MKQAIRAAMIDMALMIVAIVAVLLCGLVTGPMLKAGQADPVAWWPAILIVMGLLGVVLWFGRRGRPRIKIMLWALAGSGISVLVLCGIGSRAMPFPSARSQTVEARVPLAIHSALNIFWRPNHLLPQLSQGFKIARLDTLSAQSLAPHRRLLLAQPRLLAPEELVALDVWVRAGGRAVILADPLLLWPDGLSPGDRRRPPVTSLLDPLLIHWGLRLEPATYPQVERRFIGGDRLIALAGASRFTIGRSAFAECRAQEQGLFALCRVGRGEVRLVADADLIDDRLWLASDERTPKADTMILLDRWLRAPRMPDTAWPGASLWVRSDADLVMGLRWALITGTLWAMMGGVLFILWDRSGWTGIRATSKQKEQVHIEQG